MLKGHIESHWQISPGTVTTYSLCSRAGATNYAAIALCRMGLLPPFSSLACGEEKRMHNTRSSSPVVTGEVPTEASAQVGGGGGLQSTVTSCHDPAHHRPPSPSWPGLTRPSSFHPHKMLFFLFCTCSPIICALFVLPDGKGETWSAVDLPQDHTGKGASLRASARETG